mmetsp:Transcript_30488/g.50662  ORF Transcript_30488/g.50662 Transcript_30488/m.50662 type:complete len:104 (-) Transcript_30488:43-354(-)
MLHQEGFLCHHFGHYDIIAAPVVVLLVLRVGFKDKCDLLLKLDGLRIGSVNNTDYTNDETKRRTAPGVGFSLTCVRFFFRFVVLVCRRYETRQLKTISRQNER